jgi:hypothetical protein
VYGGVGGYGAPDAYGGYGGGDEVYGAGGAYPQQYALPPAPAEFNPEFPGGYGNGSGGQFGGYGGAPY